jgi:two-component system NtrC family response regulator/two-component system response regulator AtoC
LVGTESVWIFYLIKSMAYKKILVVDNDSSICDSLATLLRDEGYCVEETTDSAEAATLVKKNKYDVCLFDYKLDGLNGIELLKMTKEANPRCPVFIISGMVDIDQSCMKLADGIISKPFRIEALLQKIVDIA